MGSTFKAIRSDHLKKIKLIDADPALQNKFSKIVEKTEILKEHQQETKDQLDDLFNSLMQRAFKGELQ